MNNIFVFILLTASILSQDEPIDSRAINETISVASNISNKAFAENFININWRIQSIVIKQGTNDPDEIVQKNQITIIDTGSILQGIIYFKANKTITIKENNPQFYFSFYDRYHWELTDENIIQFKRLDNDGKIVQSFSYKVRFTSGGKMQWYSESVGIESGRKSVRIITLFHK